MAENPVSLKVLARAWMVRLAWEMLRVQETASNNAEAVSFPNHYRVPWASRPVQSGLLPD